MKSGELDHAGIEARIPHRGAMCLLDRLIAWDESRIDCVAVNHRDPTHPLRSRSGLQSAVAIEYAAQAAALHGGLMAEASGRTAAPGYLASARDIRLGVRRLDELPVVEDDVLRVVAERQAGDAGRLLYAFRLEHDGREIASGRLAVVLGAEAAA